MVAPDLAKSLSKDCIDLINAMQTWLYDDIESFQLTLQLRF